MASSNENFKVQNGLSLSNSKKIINTGSKTLCVDNNSVAIDIVSGVTSQCNSVAREYSAGVNVHYNISIDNGVFTGAITQLVNNIRSSCYNT